MSKQLLRKIHTLLTFSSILEEKILTLTGSDICDGLLTRACDRAVRVGGALLSLGAYIIYSDLHLAHSLIILIESL